MSIEVSVQGKLSRLEAEAVLSHATECREYYDGRSCGGVIHSVRSSSVLCARISQVPRVGYLVLAAVEVGQVPAY